MEKYIKSILTVIFLVFLYLAVCGVQLYWTVNNIKSMELDNYSQRLDSEALERVTKLDNRLSSICDMGSDSIFLAVTLLPFKSMESKKIEKELQKIYDNVIKNIGLWKIVEKVV